MYCLQTNSFPVDKIISLVVIDSQVDKCIWLNITSHFDLKAFILWIKPVYTQSIFRSSQITSLIGTKMKAVSGQISVCHSSYDRAELLWDQVVRRDLCKVSWEKPCWSPLFPFVWELHLYACPSLGPCQSHAVVMLALYLADPYLLTWLSGLVSDLPHPYGLTLVPSLDLLCSSCWDIP